MSEDIVTKHEQTSSALLNQNFSDLKALEQYLDRSGVEYLIEADSIGQEPPRSSDISWDQNSAMYYLILLPRTFKKLYRFRIYLLSEDRVHLESDFAYKNPYQ